MRILVITAFALLFSAAPVAAQTLEERIEALKLEILELHGEVASTVTALEDEIAGLNEKLTDRKVDLQQLQDAMDVLGIEPPDVSTLEAPPPVEEIPDPPTNMEELLQ